MAFLLAQKYIDYICIAFQGYRGESSGGQDFIEHRPSEAAFAALSFYRNSSFGFRRIWLSFFFDQRRNREENEAKIDGLMPGGLCMISLCAAKSIFIAPTFADGGHRR